MVVDINDKSYECYTYDGRVVDSYLHKDVLYDELPKGTMIRQYAVIDDGTTVGICTSRTWKVALMITLGILVLLAIIVAASTLFKTIESFRMADCDVEVVDDSTESAVVSIIKDTDYVLRYNRYTVLTDGYIDIMYQNIDKDVTLTIPDVECDTVRVKANEYLPSFKVTVPEDAEMPIRATMLVTIDGDKYKVPIVINDVDSIDYQKEREEHTSDNRVDLNDLTPNEDDSNYSNPSTYVNEERLIYD